MAHHLFIPAIGTIIVLAEDWRFKLFFEHRNNALLKALCPNEPFGVYAEDHEGSKILRHLEPMTEEELKDAPRTFRATNMRREPYLDVTIPAGHQLKIDRIYIRAGVEAFNSVTFRTTKIGPDNKFRSKRFWVKLNDANQIVCNIVG
jgi:hypothetical protein